MNSKLMVIADSTIAVTAIQAIGQLNDTIGGSANLITNITSLIITLVTLWKTFKKDKKKPEPTIDSGLGDNPSPTKEGV